MNPVALAVRVFGVALVVVLVAAFGFALLIGIVIAFAIAFGRRFSGSPVESVGRTAFSATPADSR